MTTPSVSSYNRNRGWSVTFAGLGINLALGVLYTWSMFKAAIGKEFGWKDAQLNDPYALCCLVFALSMIVAGRCQDKWGPRWTALQQMLFASSKSFSSSFITAAILLLVGAALTFLLQSRPQKAEAAADLAVIGQAGH